MPYNLYMSNAGLIFIYFDRLLSYIWKMKFALAFFLGIIPTLIFAQSKPSKDKRMVKAKSEYHLISNEDFEYLDCSQTVTGVKMKQFFRDYPEFGGNVKVIAIPNCYGNPGEKFFVLLFEENRDFRIPKYVNGSVKPTLSANQ